MPDLSGQWFWAWTHFKNALFALFWLVGRTKNTSDPYESNHTPCFSLYGWVRVAWSLGFVTSVKADWHGYREASIHVMRTKTGSPQALTGRLLALTVFGGATFITWHPFLGECRRGQRYFWSHCAYLSNDTAADCHVKKALCHSSVWLDTRQIPTRFANATVRVLIARSIYRM